LPSDSCSRPGFTAPESAAVETRPVVIKLDLDRSSKNEELIMDDKEFDCEVYFRFFLSSVIVNGSAVANDDFHARGRRPA
jgi:hypothetical protein